MGAPFPKDPRPRLDLRAGSPVEPQELPRSCRSRRRRDRGGRCCSPPCEPDAAAPRPSASARADVDWESWWSRKRQKGRLNFANWPYYIDFRQGSRQSLDVFTRETGIHVNYFHTIDGNESFMQEIEPYLAAGLAPFYDLVVMTNGPQVSKLMNAGYLTPLDHSRLQNFDRYASDLVRDPAWDPGNRYSAAWQSGLTGIAYRPEAVETAGAGAREHRRSLRPGARRAGWA